MSGVLVLGGTGFLGRHVVEAALDRHHDVTMFNRGLTDPGSFPQVERITGDRAVDLARLAGRRFSAVIDTNGYRPAHVRVAASLLGRLAEVYVFVSTISAYRGFSRAGLGEDAPLAETPADETTPLSPETYGPLKAACEREVLRRLPGRSIILRPGLITGPHDVTDRVGYWLVRMVQGGSVLAPGDGRQSIQLIDVRDVARFALMAVEQGLAGVFNLVRPAEADSFETFLAACQALAAGDPEICWVDEEFLLSHDVLPWADLPLWIPSADRSFAGFMAVSSARACAAGLNARPLAQTLHDTLVWRCQEPSRSLRCGLSPERESDLLQLWFDRLVL